MSDCGRPPYNGHKVGIVLYLQYFQFQKRGADHMVQGKRRKRIVYTSPENKIKAVERVLQDQIPTRQVAEERVSTLFS